MSSVILRGVVGSTAYGLARAGSDVDRLGIFVAPTLAIAGLDWHPSKESIVTRGPDVTHHEVGKFLRLILAGNPTVTELLWLPESLLETRTAEGDALIAVRSAMLSTRTVRAAYGGYATSQARRLAGRGDGYFSSSTRGRTVKHARHMLRLYRQGRQLLETGELVVQVEDPDEYFALDEMTTEQLLAIYEREASLFDAAVSVLPAEPDRAAVQDVLTEIRRAHIDQ